MKNFDVRRPARDFPFDRIMLRSTCNHELLFKSIIEEINQRCHGLHNVEDKIKDILNIYNKLGYSIEYTIVSNGSEVIFTDSEYDVHTEYKFSSGGTYKVSKTYSQDKTWKSY